MAQSITLTASMRSNLSSLKSIQSQMNTTQERLSSGKKVNSAIDNASSFYQARSLSNRAADLDALLDSMGQGIQTIQAANEGLEAVTSFVDQLKSIATSAYALDPTATDTYQNSINSYMKQFDTIINEISTLANDASYQGINLLTGGRLTVTLNESRSHRFIVQGDDIVEKMNISKASESWTSTPMTAKVPVEITEDDGPIEIKAANESATPPTEAIIAPVGTKVWTDGAKEIVQGSDGKWYEKGGTHSEVTNIAGFSIKTEEVTIPDYSASIDKTINSISIATDYLRSYTAELGNNFAVIKTRQDFTEALVDVLETGSDNLVLADMNEESANYLALQTRQQLAINSLSLASQSAQAVLKLF